MFAYIGGYTSEKRGGLGKGGISIYRKEDGEKWEMIQSYEIDNPTFLAFNSSKTVLYSVQGDGKTISAFSVGKDGRISLMNQKNTGYMNGVFVTVSPDDKFLIVSNCSLITKCGSILVYALAEDGRIGNVCSITIPEGKFGPLAGTQEGVKPHQTRYDNRKEFLVECDKALDQVNTYLLDENGQLVLKHTLQWRPASCPRHISFHPNGKLAFLLTEWLGTIVACNYVSGELVPFAVYSTLPTEYVGLKNTAAEVAVHPNGKYLYASNREENSIVKFEITDDGHLINPVWTKQGMSKARFFLLSEDGSRLYCANERSHNVTIFTVDEQTGSLSLTEEILEASAPSCILLK